MVKMSTASLNVIGAFISCLTVSFLSQSVHAAFIPAASANYEDVRAVVTSAQDGDTILVPSTLSLPGGVATWTQTLNLGNKAIQLVGAGKTSTVIQNNAPGGLLIASNNTGHNLVRISGFRFNNVDLMPTIVYFAGPSYKVRVDHCYFNRGDSAIGTNQYWISRGAGAVWGVADHNDFYNMTRPYFATDSRTTDAALGSPEGVIPGGNYDGATAWSEPILPGSDHMMYFEDNNFVWNDTPPSNVQAALYGSAGGRVVFRYNTVTGTDWAVDAHGDYPSHSTVYYEIYNNTFNYGTYAGIQGEAMWQRGGQWIVHDNTFNYPYNSLIHVSVYWPYDSAAHRIKNSYFWGNTVTGRTSDQSLIVGVKESGQTPAGYSNTNVKLDREYFLHPPQMNEAIKAYDANGNVTGTSYRNSPYASYTPLVYPHPLVSSVVSSGAIPTDRLTDWSQAGVPGGIPSSSWDICITPQCQAVANPNPNIANYAVLIADALSTAPDNSVVKLGTGTYNFKSFLDTSGSYPIRHNVKRSNVALRGDGPDKTILKLTAPTSYAYGEANIAFGAEEAWPEWPVNKIFPIVSGSTRGSTSIVSSGSAVAQVGDIMLINQLNGTIPSNTLPTGTLTITGQGNVGTGSYKDPSADRDRDNTRNLQQVVKVTGINGNSITFTPALAWDFTLSPEMALAPYTVHRVGVEDLKIDGSLQTSKYDANYSFIGFHHADQCWMKGVELSNGRTLFQIRNSLQCEVRDSYIHDPIGAVFVNGSDNGYGQVLMSSNILIENNIFRKMLAPIIYAGVSNSVVGYNYILDLSSGNAPQIAASIDVNHGGHGLFNLVEGNVAPGVLADDFYGSSSHGMVFRNYLLGTDAWKNRCDQRAVSLDWDQLYYSVIGNVLGVPHTLTEINNGCTDGDPTTIKTQAYEAVYGFDSYGNPLQGYDDPVIYKLGWQRMGDYGGDWPDVRVKDTLLRWGNYDYANKVVRWNINERPDKTVVSHALPNSLYRTAKPAWFGATAWPAIGPDVTGGAGEVLGSGETQTGLVSMIPAQRCYQMQNLANGGIFNPAACYGNNPNQQAAPTITLQPSNQPVVLGGTATFTVVATGNPSPTYQWMRVGVPISGAIAASYKIDNVSNADIVNYTVVVTNTLGTVTSSGATLVIVQLPTVQNGTVLPVTVGQKAFNLIEAGTYELKGWVSTINPRPAGLGTNSFFIDIDANPQGDSTRVWDIDPASGYQSANVTWRGVGSNGDSCQGESSCAESSPCCAEFNPKRFTLTAGNHVLYIVNREGALIQNMTFTKDTSGEIPINGVCGSMVNSCTAGTFKDIVPDSSTQYLWVCEGSSRDLDQQCSLNIPVYTLMINKSGSGTVTCNGGTCPVTFSAGSTVDIATTPNTAVLSGACTGTGSCRVTMDSAKTVIATFVPITNTITATAGANGTISPSGSVNVNSGAGQLFTITPNTGYAIDQVLVDGVALPAPVPLSYTFSNVTAAHTITASFILKVNNGTSLPVSPKASHRFYLAESGTYKLTGLVSTVNLAPAGLGTNSFYLDIDANPAGDNTRTWDITPAVGYQLSVVSWRGINSATCQGLPSCAEINPKTFILAAGIHTLYIGDREPGTLIKNIAFTKLTTRGTRPPPPRSPPGS